MQNTGKLAGCTAFITGASRGIGKAIALKFAKNGANIVIAAKTATEHPKLPGTIYTAAKEVESVGGKCLPCIVDIRNEESLKEAAKLAAAQFGGIDILVNNASAISLTGTAETPLKRFDLMMGVNARGTFTATQVCLPYLKKAANPHVLTISPPLNMKPVWFKGHVAYTMAKYGMSMCTLGWADEFKEDGIAANSLWPRTAIATAAMKMLGGDDSLKMSRTPEIMADAAYAIVTKDSRTVTGNFFVDDTVLMEEGISDFDQYACVPGNKLLPDFFLDSAEESDATLAELKSSGGGNLEKFFQRVSSLITPELVTSTRGIIVFDVDNQKWFIDLKNGEGSAGKGMPPTGNPDATITLKEADFMKLVKGEASGPSLLMSGKLKLDGSMGIAMKLENIVAAVRSKL
ncbi:hydroxysteroid dehydrogenase-like protein 2 [Oscarella lobularis]|uniref:hydroxysteroid dehydrogenase-like protein 2 n=1 Tax=Oscarella lobularis TaxID=121494 RepID=UPI00331359E4